MGCSMQNSKGIEYHLHSAIAKKNKRTIFFFSKNPEGSIDLPEGYEIMESPISHILMLKKIR